MVAVKRQRSEMSTLSSPVRRSRRISGRQAIVPSIESALPEESTPSLAGPEKDLSQGSDEDLSDVSSANASEESDPEGYDSDYAVTRGRGNNPSKPASKKAKSTTVNGVKLTDKELLRYGTTTGLGPGYEVVIEKPKARGPGKTPYRDETIHPNTMIFLKDLRVNNDRSWLKDNDPDFRAAQRDFESFAESITTALLDIDPTIPELPIRDNIFRIHRDVRFSKSKLPYKPYLSAAWSRQGRKGQYAMYYIQVQPDSTNGGTLLAGGLYTPEKEFVSIMRQRIGTDARQLREILASEQMKKMFWPDASKGIHGSGVAKQKAIEDKCISSFCGMNAAYALKTRPQGFSSDHPEIELLRLKSYTLWKTIPNKDLSIKSISEVFSAMEPLVTWCNSVVLPDESDVDEDESDQDDDQDVAEGAGTGSADENTE